MKLLLIFYAVTGLLFILALCRAASRRNVQELSASMELAEGAYISNARSVFPDAQLLPVDAPLKVDFNTEIVYRVNVTATHSHHEQQDHRQCAYQFISFKQM